MTKELNAQQIKQLEENANLMKQNGFSDKEIQDMSMQYIDKYGVVKKKENTIPTSKSVSTSSNTASKSTSQNQNKAPIGTIQAGQNPNTYGIGNVLPITEEQKKAGKELLGQGTKIAETTKKQTTSENKNTYPTPQELLKQSGGIGSDVTKDVKQKEDIQTKQIEQFGTKTAEQREKEKEEEAERQKKQEFDNQIDQMLVAESSVFGNENVKDNILDYFEINLKANDLENRLSKEDKALYETINKVDDFRNKLTLLDTQYKNGDLSEFTYKQQYDKVKKESSTLEYQATTLIEQRNKDIENEIKSLKTQLANGKKEVVGTTNVSGGIGTLGAGLGSYTQQVSLSENDRKEIQKQIKILEAKKGLFTDNIKQQEQIDSFKPEIAKLKEKKIIPDGANVKESLKLLYAQKHKKLQELIKKSKIEGKASVSSQKGWFGKAKEYIADKFLESTETGQTVAGYENPIRQYLIEDETSKDIYNLQEELNTLAPIIALNRYGTYKNESEWTKFGKTFTQSLIPTKQGKILTETEIAQNTQTIINDLGLREIKGVTEKDIQDNKYSVGEMLGTTGAFMVQFSIPTGGGQAMALVKGISALTKVPKLIKIADKVNDVVNYTQKSRIGRFLKSAVEEGVKYEVKGQVYKGVLGGEADFVSGSSGVLGEKVMSKLVGVFGVKLPNILKPIERLLGRGAGETGEETMQTIWQVYKESENFEDFKNTLGEQFATLKDVQHFVLSTALMGMAFGVSGELSKAWDTNRKKAIDKLKKEGKYTEEDEKQVNEILKDLTQEHETAVNDEIDNGVTLTDEEVMQMADEFTETTEVDGEEMKVVSKDEDKAIVLDETNNKLKQITLLAQGKGVVSTLTNDKINIANKLNQNIELNADEQDFYNNYKEDIEKIRYENQNAPIEPINTGEEQINSTGVSTETKDDTGLGTGNEQTNVSDQKEIQQDNETEKQIAEVKQVIQELEANPNSPFSKLVNLDEQKQKLAELEKKQAEVKKESAQPILPETKAQKAANPRLSALPKKKEVSTEKVEEKVDNVEIKKLQEEIDSFDDEYNRLVDAVNKEDRKLNTPKSENEIKLNQLQDKINALIDKRNKLQEQQTPTQQSGEVVSGSVDNPALRDVESTAKQKSDPDLANIDPVIIAARNGDKQAQKKLEEYGLDWEQTTTYRFVGQPEVDVLLSDKKVESKRFSDAGIDVTTSPKVTSAANAEYRVTFKESFDVNNGLGKVKLKSKEEGDHNLEKGRGYTLNDVAKIERLDENGNVVEVIYDSESLLSKEQPTQEEGLSPKIEKVELYSYDKLPNESKDDTSQLTENWRNTFEELKAKKDNEGIQILYNKLKVLQNGVIQGKAKSKKQLDNTLADVRELEKDIEDYAEQQKTKKIDNETETITELLAPKESKQKKDFAQEIKNNINLEDKNRNEQSDIHRTNAESLQPNSRRKSKTTPQEVLQGANRGKQNKRSSREQSKEISDETTLLKRTTDGQGDILSRDADVLETPTEKNKEEKVEQINQVEQQEPALVDFELQNNEDTSFNATQKYNDNINALKTLITLLREKRKATPQEKKVLAKYVGFGGLKEIGFNPDNDADWKESTAKYRNQVRKIINLTKELDELLNIKNSISDIRAGIQTAHFTSKTIIDSIYKGIEKLGFKGGRILEPSAGIGNFIGYMPSKIKQNSNIQAIELDPITGNVLKYLYDDVNTQVTGLQKAILSNNSQDLVISNIPFGSFKVFDKEFKGAREKLTTKIHNYFFAKALDQVREGGIIAFVTSKGVLDSKGNQEIRNYISQNANFLGAVRLPSSAFKNVAGTEVIADVIFLQKNTINQNQNQSFINVVEKEVRHKDGEKQMVTINQYFEENPQNVLGEIVAGGLYSRSGYTVIENNSQMNNLAKIIQDVLPSNVYQESKTEIDNNEQYLNGNVINYIENTKEGTLVQIKEDDNKLMRREGNELKEVVLPKYVTSDSINRFIDIRNALNELIYAEYINESEDVLNRLRAKLNDKYNNIQNLNKTARKEFDAVAKQDADGFIVQSLTKPDGSKADILSKRVINPLEQKTSATNIDEAIVISLYQDAKINIEKIAELLNTTIDEVIQLGKGKIFENPLGGFETREEYLSGNVKKKLAEAQKGVEQGYGEFQLNVDELLQVQPKDLLPVEIDAKIGVRWIPSDVYSQFAQELLNDSSLKITYAKSIDTYTSNSAKPSTVEATQKYGTKRKNGLDIMLGALSMKPPVVYDTLPDKSTIVNKEETEKALEKYEEVREAFEDWVYKDVNRRERLARIYNDTYNTTIKRKYNGSHLNIAGINGINLRPHQKDAIWMLLQNNGGIIDHMVGAGKTFVMVAGTMEMKRTGVAKKPMIIALKSTIPQIVETYRVAYPMAKILAPTEKDFTKQNRQKLFSQIAINDWDVIIMSHENYGAIPHDQNFEAYMLQEEINEVEAERNELDGDKKALQGLETRLKNLQDKLEKLLDRPKDNTTTFQQMGIDHIMVDESQQFKNLAYVTKTRGISGLSKPQGSQRSFNLLLGIRYLQNLHNGDKGTTFLSGTPISNSMVEMYLLLKYLRLNKMKELGFNSFDAWATTFSHPRNEIEYTVTGQFKSKTAFREFINLPELSILYNEIADVRNDNNLKLDKPAIKGGKPELISIEMTDDQLDYAERLLKTAETKDGSYIGRNLSENEEKALMLLITNLGSKMAIDMRLIDPKNYSYNPNSKIGKLVENVAKIYHETTEHLGTQFIFSDIGTPKNKANKSLTLKDYMQDEMGIVEDTLNEIFGDVNEENYKTPDIEVVKKRLKDILELENDEIKDMLVKADESADSFNVYDEVKLRLIEQGVKKEEIVFIHSYNTQKAKEQLFEKINKGEIRVVLGSTQKLGTGVNAQERGVALHHLDVPWRPSDMEQRNGRFVRQGNIIAKQFYNNEVGVYNYATERTLDVLKYNKLATKSNFINQIKEGNVEDRTMKEDDTSNEYAEIVASISGNTDIIEKFKLEDKKSKLQRSKRNFEATLQEAQSNLRLIDSIIDSVKERIDNTKKDRLEITDKLEYDIVVDEAGKEIKRFKINNINGEVLKPKEEGKKLERNEYGKKAIELINEKLKSVPFNQVVKAFSINGIDILAKKEDKSLDSAGIVLYILGGSGRQYTVNYSNVGGVLLNNIQKAIENIPNLIKSQEKVLENKINDKIAYQEIVKNTNYPKEQELKETLNQLKDVNKRLEDYGKSKVEEDTNNEKGTIQDDKIRIGDVTYPVFNEDVDVSIVEGRNQKTNELNYLVRINKTLDYKNEYKKIVEPLFLNNGGEWNKSHKSIIFTNKNNALLVINRLKQELGLNNDYFDEQQPKFQATDKSKFTKLGKEIFDKFAKRLKAVFPKIKLNTFTDWKEAVGHTQLRTPNGTVYGFVKDGQVFINENELNANTLVHEYGHIFAQILKAQYPTAHKNLIDRIKQEKALIEAKRKDPNYANLTTEQLADEVLSELIGNKGETILNTKKPIHKEILDILNRFWNRLKNIFTTGSPNIAKWSVEQFQNATIDDIVNNVTADLLSGRKLSDMGSDMLGGKSKFQLSESYLELIEGFYSPLEKIINETKFEKLPAKQWLDKFGKGDEAKWTGLTEWLSQQQGSVSKADIQQYLKDNRIQVVEVVKGEVSNFTKDDISDVKINQHGAGNWVVKTKEDGTVEFPLDKADDKAEAIEYALEQLNYDNKSKRESKPKFQSYQLEGEKENYKEVLVTMPTNKTNAETNVTNFFNKMKDKYGEGFVSKLTTEENAERLKLKDALDNQPKNPPFKSSHFDEPNILVHLRMNTRTDADGNKVLFLEELQSDFGQQGKKQGFKVSDSDKNNKIALDKKARELGGYKFLSEAENKWYDDYTSGKLGSLKEDAIPQAPFVTDTNAWTKLALKVALKEAVKQDADKIAWTTGEQQNERYDLSKQVEDIWTSAYSDSWNGKNYDKLKDVEITLKGSEVKKLTINESGKVISGDFNGESLDNIVGKEMAEKIINAKDDTNFGEQDLKVGGKGMKGFYGSPTEGKLGIVGNVAKSLFKQEVGTVELQTTSTGIANQDKVLRFRDWVWKNKTDDFSYSDAQKNIDNNSTLYQEYQKNIPTQHSIDITPELKVEVESGLPLFQIKDNQKETKNLLQNVIDNGINIDDLINYWKENNFDFDEQNIRDTYAELTQEVETKLDEEIKENSVESTDDSGGKTKKKTLVYKRIYTDKKTTQEEKEALEKLGLDYKVESQTKVANEVIRIIDEIGLDGAFGMARSGEFTPSYRNYIYAKVLEDLRNRIFIETDEEQRKSLIEERTFIANELDIKLRNEGRGGSIMKRAGADTMLNYDVAWREAEFKEEFDKEISKETKEKLLELEKRLAEQEAKIRELEEKKKNFTADDTIKAIKSKGKKRTASYKAKVLADRFRKLKTKHLELKDANGNPINITLNSVVSYNEIIEIGAKIIEKGGQLLEAINEVLKKLEEQEWFQKLNDNDKKAIERQITDHLSIDDNIDEDIKIPKDLLYDLVEKGLEINPNYSIDNLVDDVIETLGLDVADKREIRDKITNYGEEIKMPEGKVHEKLRELKRIGKLLSGIEDLEQGQLPKRSGLQRDETTTEERRLRQIINEKLKEIQKSDEVLESEWKSALDKLKTRYKKRIEDLKAQIDAKEKTIKEKNVIKLDDDALKLKTELSEVLKAYKEMFGNNELSAEARIKMREKALKKQIADTQNRIEYIKEKGKDVEKKKPSKVESDLITTLEQDLAKEKKELLELQKTKGLIDKKKIELAKARVEKQIAEYERRIKEKDFSKKEKYVLPFDEELNKAKLAKYHAKKEFDTLFYREELKNRSMQRVIYDFILDLINTPKSLKATLDLSAPLRQGATLLLSNNKEFRKAFIEMHKMAKNRDYYDNFLADLENSKDYILIKDSGLVITDVDGKLEVKEETFMLGLANKIPILKIFNKASERGYSGFLNSLRVGVFRDGVEQLKKAGITFENNPKAYKSLANFVNNATGRGKLTTSEGTNKLLNTLFFSPRMITSRIGMIYTLFDPDAPMVVKKMSAKSLASFALYVSVVNVLGTILVNALDDDDDDDELKDKLNKNPLATDFLKVKYDDTRYDITAGYSTIIRTLARFIKGERINSQGRIKELDGSGYYGETRWSEVGAFFSNKLAPTTRVLYNVSTGKHPEDYYKTIDDATTKDYLKALFVPIGVESLYEDITDKEKEELKIATDFLLNFYGVSVQKY
jgi:N12 class adenine-specific DNA methylase